MKRLYFDFEIFKDDWFVTFLDDDNKTHTIRNDRIGLMDFINQNNDILFVGFNNKYFDNYCVKAIYNNVNPFIVCQEVIVNKTKPWNIPELKYKKNINFIWMDLMVGLSPATTLKDCMANFGMSIIELEIDPKTEGILPPDVYNNVLNYNINDCLATKKLFDYREENEKLYTIKNQLIKTFNLSLNRWGHTNPMISAEILQARRLQCQDEEFTYKTPTFIKMIDNSPQKHFESVVLQPETKTTFSKNMQECECKFGIGGLHGAKSNVYYTVEPDSALILLDFESLYPNLMANNTNKELQFFTRACLSNDLFKDLKEQRKKYKLEKNTTMSNGLKLIINSIFGATLQTHSDLEDWSTGRNICITGQLISWAFGEKLSLIDNTEILQLNTDGVLLKTKISNIPLINFVKEQTEKVTGINLEMEVIKNGSIFQKDVNNYILANHDTKTIKTKGGEVCKYYGGNSEQNSLTIIDKSVVDYFVYNIPISKTIKEAWDNGDYIRFQIVLSRKGSNFTQSFYNNKLVQKTNRVFATVNKECGMVTKMKNGAKHKFANSPEHQYVYNHDMKDFNQNLAQIDLMWYINMAIEVVNDFKEGRKRK